MTNKILHCLIIVPVMFSLQLYGCASNSEYLSSYEDSRLPLIPGEATLQVDKIKTADLALQNAKTASYGTILLFSPIEFRSIKKGLAFESAFLPLGRYVASRVSSEGITADLQQSEARSFSLHYDAHFPDLQAARRDFPGLPEQRYRKVTLDGKPAIEIEQWRIRTTMIFSKERRAFRVLLDDLNYTAPVQKLAQDDDTAISDKYASYPVVVIFSYQHPDNVSEKIIQQNVFFEFNIVGNNSEVQGKAQLSAWVPLPDKVESLPYTVSLLVAELHEKREDIYKKLLEMLKNVRSVI